MTKKRLFIVINPTQYLNAVEYANATHSQEDHLAILTYNQHSFEELNKLGANRFWSEIHLLDFSEIEKLNSDRKVWQRSYKFLKGVYERLLPDELIIGNLIDNMVYPFLLFVKRNHSIFVNLDDGTPTLNIVFNRVHSTYFRTYHIQNIKSLIKKVLYLGVFPPFIKPPVNIEFFTLYDIDVSINDKLFKNEYSWTRSKIIPMQSTNEALFIGSHLVDRGIVSEEVYLDSLDYASKQAELEGFKFVYIQHRSESPKIRKKIEKHYPTRKYSLPLELVFIEQPRPAVFLGHFSSALFTLSRIYDTSIKAYLFDGKYIKGNKSEPRDYILRLQQALILDKIIETKIIPHGNIPSGSLSTSMSRD